MVWGNQWLLRNPSQKLQGKKGGSISLFFLHRSILTTYQNCMKKINFNLSHLWCFEIKVSVILFCFVFYPMFCAEIGIQRQTGHLRFRTRQVSLPRCCREYQRLLQSPSHQRLNQTRTIPLCEFIYPGFLRCTSILLSFLSG